MVRTEFDAHTRKVTFLVEAKADLEPLKLTISTSHLFDADKVRINIIEANNQRLEEVASWNFSESEDADGLGFMRRSFLKGERLRVSFELPDATVWGAASAKCSCRWQKSAD